MINGIPNSQYPTNYPVQPVPGYQAVQPNTVGYTQPDNFSRTAALTAASNTPTYPVSSIIEDMTVSNRYQKFFIKDTNRLLSWGSNGIGKFFLNVMAGNIPLFTAAEKSQAISTNVTRWVGRADLLRLGANPIHTFLLQDAGIMNVTDISRITNAVDQQVLSQRIQMAAVSRGVTDIPSLMAVQQWVQLAQTLPKKL